MGRKKMRNAFRNSACPVRKDVTGGHRVKSNSRHKTSAFRKTTCKHQRPPRKTQDRRGRHVSPTNVFQLPTHPFKLADIIIRTPCMYVYTCQPNTCTNSGGTNMPTVVQTHHTNHSLSQVIVRLSRPLLWLLCFCIRADTSSNSPELRVRSLLSFDFWSLSCFSISLCRHGIRRSSAAEGLRDGSG